MTEIVVKLPWPPQQLKPNWRGHWASTTGNSTTLSTNIGSRGVSVMGMCLCTFSSRRPDHG